MGTSLRKRKKCGLEGEWNVKKCIDSVTELANDKRSHVKEVNWNAAEDKFTRWYKCSFNSSYFDDELFRAVYISNLYEKRVESFYNLLKNLSEDLKNSIFTYETIMSLGCGACPEIVAFLHYYEKDLGCRNYKNLSEIIGIDAIDDWRIYHPCIKKHFKKDIIFKNDVINDDFISKLEEVDLILIYDLIGTKYGKIWSLLKNKCKTIIILHFDEDLFPILERNGYQHKTFKDKQEQKHYYYFTRSIASNQITKKQDKIISLSTYENLVAMMNELSCHTYREIYKLIEKILTEYNKHLKEEIIRNMIGNIKLDNKMILSMNCVFISANIISKLIEEHSFKNSSFLPNFIDIFIQFSNFASSNALAERLCESVLYAICSIQKITRHYPKSISLTHFIKILQKNFRYENISEEIKLASSVILVNLYSLNNEMIEEMKIELKKYLTEIHDKLIKNQQENYFGFSIRELEDVVSAL